MNLSTQQAGVLARVMATLAEPHAEGEIRVRLGALMLELLDAQHYASYVWDPAQQRFDAGVQMHMDPANLRLYDRYFQFHDPITLKLQQHRRAVRVGDVLAQPALMRTEFFNDFLARDGLHWGVNLYAWSADRNIGDMRIWRDRRHDDFGADELALLDLIRPAFTAALQRCRAETPAAAALRGDPSAAPGATTPRAARGLSAREREVAALAACGLPDKAIARRLAISVTTVRTHLDHAFRKLGVANRVQLAHRLAA